MSYKDEQREDMGNAKNWRGYNPQDLMTDELCGKKK